jgi:DNA polymerase III delta prime subunit
LSSRAKPKGHNLNISKKMMHHAIAKNYNIFSASQKQTALKKGMSNNIYKGQEYTKNNNKISVTNK